MAWVIPDFSFYFPSLDVPNYESPQGGAEKLLLLIKTHVDFQDFIRENNNVLVYGFYHLGLLDLGFHYIWFLAINELL